MDAEILVKIGLSRAEIKVYIALLEIGVSTTGPLTKKSGIPSSNIYPILDDLIKKGLVSYTITANKKYYKAEEPKILKQFTEEQKQRLIEQEGKLNNLIQELTNIQFTPDKKQEISIYEELKGIKTALEHVLKVLHKEDTFYVIDASKISNEKLMGYFNDFHKRRAKQGIKYDVLFGDESLNFAKERKTYALTTVKVLPQGIKIPAVFWIFKEYAVIAVFSEKPVAVMIKNKQVSDAFLTHFKILESISKKI